MRIPEKPPERIAIAFHPNMEGAEYQAARVAASFASHNKPVEMCASFQDGTLRQRIQAGQLDLLVMLGGDGSMLRAGNLCAPAGVPVLGINLGRFGFLIEVRKNGWQEYLPRLLSGDYWLEDRMMLHVEHIRNNRPKGQWEALNEVVVCRGQFVRPIRVSAFVDERLLAHYVADGLIAATATGSTAYAMAAGGPVLSPELRNILVVAVAPHLSMDQAVILPEGARVTMQVEMNHEAVLSVDGHLPMSMLAGDSVQIAAGDHVVSFVRFEDQRYFYRNLARYMERNPSTGDPE